jgi:hypothetical protein
MENEASNMIEKWDKDEENDDEMELLIKPGLN